MSISTFLQTIHTLQIYFKFINYLLLMALPTRANSQAIRSSDLKSYMRKPEPKRIPLCREDAKAMFNDKGGFSNAIEVKIQPDTALWDAGDIRYNVLRWTSSPSPPWGGYGPSFVNPRTGEILGADIMLEWTYITNRIVADELFNEENSEMHDSHLCNAGMLQSIENNFGLNYIKSMNLSEELEDELVKQSLYRLVLHEVGHTLGLSHNFKGSTLLSTSELNNKTLLTEGEYVTL